MHPPNQQALPHSIAFMSPLPVSVCDISPLPKSKQHWLLYRLDEVTM